MIKVEHVLSDIHGKGTNGGHMGEKRTQANITERFYWRTITEDVKKWVSCAVFYLFIYCFTVCLLL